MNLSLYYQKLIRLPYSPHLEESLLVSNAKSGPKTFALLFLSVCNVVLKCLLYFHKPCENQLDEGGGGKDKRGNTDFVILSF